MNTTLNKFSAEELWKQKPANKLYIYEKELHIWRHKISNNSKKVNYYWNLLSKDEQTNANEFYFFKDRINYIICRGKLRELIANYIDIHPADVKLEYARYGKPYIATINNNKIINFNLSHSNDYFVLGIAKNIDIGIDIEFCDYNIDIENMTKYLFASDEYNKFKNFKTNKKYDYFYTLWTKKEAILKLLGKGLYFDLREINLGSLQAELTQQRSYIFNYDSSNLNIFINTFFAYDGYYSAFATNEIPHTILYFDCLAQQ